MTQINKKKTLLFTKMMHKINTYDLKHSERILFAAMILVGFANFLAGHVIRALLANKSASQSAQNSTFCCKVALGQLK